MIVLETLRQALFVTALVATMLIAVEYLNVLTRGKWQQAALTTGPRQYLLAVLLGASPGCLGAFVVVALYTHRMVSLGALAACMIATSGDEAFVMLALFPRTAILLTLALALIGVLTGWLTDLVARAEPTGAACHQFILHEEETCECFPRGRVLQQLRHLSLARGVLAAGMFLLVTAVAGGQVGPREWDWMRVTLLGVGWFGLFVVLTVPEHFLEEHLWEHTMLQHVPRVFAWTLGALATIALLEHLVYAEVAIRENHWAVLGGAALLGLVPESGPHLLFVTLYERGIIPVSTLITSTIVQDGHGMLPLLAHSRWDFLKVKGINLAVGLLVGALLMILGR